MFEIQPIIVMTIIVILYLGLNVIGALVRYSERIKGFWRYQADFVGFLYGKLLHRELLEAFQ